MPSPLQTASARRKVVYLGLIFGLFVVNTFFWRGVSSPLTGNQPPAWTVQARAANLELTEEAQGETDLLGSTVRLILTGSRGLAVTVLWNAAIDKQMRHEWNELEFLVRSLTKLQPHFLTPWLFQSWNLTYNVSVESDRVKDKYFYIGRGIELLAQGERLNKDNPDMRYWIGFYYQNKFGVSDEANSLRSLFQLSCIKPDDRNPDVLAPKDPRTGRRVVDSQKFEQFCQQHPQLVRRLREPPKELMRPFRCNTPEEVVEFLADSRRIPGRFVDPDLDAGLLRGRPGDLKPADQQFPVLPTSRPARYNPTEEQPTAADTLDDTFDAYVAARAWLSYAQDPLPDPEPMTELQDRKDRLKNLHGRRLPRQPAEILFRQSPCRAQSYVGERLHKEGWFDDSGWVVDAGRSGLGRWFPPGRDVVVGKGKDWGTEAWTRAFAMWREFGKRNGMLLEGAEEVNLDAKAARFRERYHIDPNDMALGFRPEALPPDLAESLLAHRRLFFSRQNLQMTNFLHHYAKAKAEKDRETAQARKTVDRAEQFRRAAEPERAIEAFEQGFAQWKAVLLSHSDFRADDSTQEDLYESEIHYLDLVRDHRGDQVRPLVTFQGLAAAAAASAGGAGSPAPLATGLAYQVLTDVGALPLPIVGPFDGTDPEGKVWIRPDIMSLVRSRLNIEAPAAAPRTPAPAGEPQPVKRSAAPGG